MDTPSTFLKGRRLALGALAGAVVVVAVGAAPARASTVSLLLPQSTAFGILGHSCGGIREQAYATGFDPASGYPTGDVHVSTSCSSGGRGSRPVVYAAWVAVVWDFAGNTLSATKLASAPTVNAAFSATDAYGDTVANVGGAALLTALVPGAPTSVQAVQLGDQFQVTWRLNGTNPRAITQSSVTASDLTATVPGQATSALLGPLQPNTIYKIAVVSATAGGTGPSSAAIYVKTSAASVPPSAPTGVSAHWASQDPSGSTQTLIVAWNAAVPGNSPVDWYQITTTGSDGGGTMTQSVPGTALTTSFTVDFVPNWTVMVRAHNAAGWGPESTSFTLGGL